MANSAQQPIAFAREQKANETRPDCRGRTGGAAHVHADPGGDREIRRAFIIDATEESWLILPLACWSRILGTIHAWLARLAHHLNWDGKAARGRRWLRLLPPLTAYNAISTLEAEANRRLLASLHVTRSATDSNKSGRLRAAKGFKRRCGRASNSNPSRPHRDAPWLSRQEGSCRSGDWGRACRKPRSAGALRYLPSARRVLRRRPASDAFDPSPYRAELDRLWRESGGRQLPDHRAVIWAAADRSIHPSNISPARRVLPRITVCRSSSMRCRAISTHGRMYASRPTASSLIWRARQGMGNGIPVNAAVGRADVFASLGYGGGSDTWPPTHRMRCHVGDA